MPTLFEKSGAESQYRRFKFEIAKIAERDELPGYALTLETPAGKREPNLRMRRRADAERPVKSVSERPTAATATAVPPSPAPEASTPEDATVDVSALLRRARTSLATRSTAGEITDSTLATLRAECPGWDYQTLHAEFRAWVEADGAHTPVSYQAAFIGYVRRFDAKHRHELGTVARPLLLNWGRGQTRDKAGCWWLDRPALRSNHAACHDPRSRSIGIQREKTEGVSHGNAKAFEALQQRSRPK